MKAVLISELSAVSKHFGSLKHHLLSKSFRDYALGYFLTLLTSLLSIPILISNLGIDSWTSIVVAQSLGMLASLLIDFGYGFSGTSSTGALSEFERTQVYRESFRIRFRLALIVLPTIIMIYIFTIESSNNFNTMILVATSVQSLSSAWIFQSEKQTRLFLIFIILPRVSANLLGSLLTYFYYGYFLFALILGIAQMFSLIGALWFLKRVVMARHEFYKKQSNPSVSFILKSRSRHFCYSILFAALNFMPVIIASKTVADPKILSTFVLLDRCSKYFVGFLSPLVQYLQSFVPQKQKFSTQIRLRKSLIICTEICIVFPFVAVFTFPFLAKVLTHSQLQVSGLISYGFGLIVGFQFFLNVLGSIHIVLSDLTVRLVSYSSIIVFFNLILFIGLSLFDSLALLLTGLLIGQVTLIGLYLWHLKIESSGSSIGQPD